jgi:hypothetical protein
MPRYIAKPSATKRLITKITHLFQTRVLRKTVGQSWWLSQHVVPDDNRLVLLRTKFGEEITGWFVSRDSRTGGFWVDKAGLYVNAIAWREL